MPPRKKRTEEALASLKETISSKIITADEIKSLKKDGHNILSLGDFEDIVPLSSGSMLMDYILFGGFGRGKIIEIFGASGSAKTHFIMGAQKAAQLRGEKILHVDAEDAFVPQRARQLGISRDGFLVTHERTLENLFPMIRKVIKENDVSFVTIDSLDALLSVKMWRDDVGDMLDKHNVGVKAKLLGAFFKGMIEIISESSSKFGKHVTLLCTNQIRHDPGIMMGDNTIASGGEAPKFYSFQRVRVRPSRKIEVGTNKDKKEIGRIIHAVVEKNRLGPPKETAEFEFLYETGFNENKQLVEVCKMLKMIEQSGARYVITSTGESFFGAAALYDKIEADEELRCRLNEEASKKIRQRAQWWQEETIIQKIEVSDDEQESVSEEELSEDEQIYGVD